MNNPAKTAIWCYRSDFDWATDARWPSPIAMKFNRRVNQEMDKINCIPEWHPRDLRYSEKWLSQCLKFCYIHSRPNHHWYESRVVSVKEPRDNLKSTIDKDIPNGQRFDRSCLKLNPSPLDLRTISTDACYQKTGVGYSGCWRYLSEPLQSGPTFLQKTQELVGNISHAGVWFYPFAVKIADCGAPTHRAKTPCVIGDYRPRKTIASNKPMPYWSDLENLLRRIIELANEPRLDKACCRRVCPKNNPLGSTKADGDCHGSACGKWAYLNGQSVRQHNASYVPD